MPTATFSRPITDSERSALERILRAVPNRFGRFKTWLTNTFLLWAVLLLATIIAWLIVAAAAKGIAGVSIGWKSTCRFEIVAWCALVSAALSAVYNYGWITGLKDRSPEIQADLSAGVVNEEYFSFTAVKRVQEPEHGGLIYFLKTSSGQAYVLYDRESQTLGAGGADPLHSSFAPKEHLLSVRTPNSRIVLSSEFSGVHLRLFAPTDLLLDPSSWPEQDEYCSVPWEQLEEHFGKNAR